MESLGHEVVPFEDVVCQMWDMLKLGDRTYVTLQVSGPPASSGVVVINEAWALCLHLTLNTPRHC